MSSSEPRERIPTSSPDLLAGRLEQFRALFPEAFVEGKVDLDKLRTLLGEAAESGPGRFSFTWAGKDDALALLQTPSTATLLPCPKESVEFATTRHAFIEGDNLEVLKLLFKPYFGRVKLIYIDPPYNTGQDFVYPDNWASPLQPYLELTGQADADGNLLTSNAETSGRYHSAWLSMMYPRLFLARQLLRDDGVLCVSIDDHEVHHLRMLLDEIFGEENFVATCIWQKRYSRENRGIIGDVHEYLVVYARDVACCAEVRNLLPLDEESRSHYRNPNNDPMGPWQSVSLTAQGYRANQMYTITAPNGTAHSPPPGRCWSVTEPEYRRLQSEGRIWFGENGTGVPRVLRYLSEVEGLVPWTWWPHEEVGHTDEAKKEIHGFFGKEQAFDTPKPVRLMKRVLHIGTKPDQENLVVDFFAGSGTLAQAVLELNREDGGNRRFLLVQLPEPTDNPQYKTIADIGKERVRRVIQKLRDECRDQFAFATDGPVEDLGFKVFKLAEPRIRPWAADTNRDPDVYVQKLIQANDPLIDGWRAEDVLWEVALREGFGLACRFTSRKLATGNTVYTVTDPDKQPEQSFLVCLDKAVRIDLVRHLDLTPDRLFVCRDAALDDTAAANLALQCRLKVI